MVKYEIYSDEFEIHMGGYKTEWTAEDIEDFYWNHTSYRCTNLEEEYDTLEDAQKAFEPYKNYYAKSIFMRGCGNTKYYLCTVYMLNETEYDGEDIEFSNDIEFAAEPFVFRG